MALKLNSQYFIAELKCLIIQARSPSVDISEGAKVEAAIWGAIEEIAGVAGLKKERVIFERLYACGTGSGAIRNKLAQAKEKKHESGSISRPTGSGSGSALHKKRKGRSGLQGSR